MTKRRNPPVPVGRRAIEGKLPYWRDRISRLSPGESFTVKATDNIVGIQKLNLKAAQQLHIPITTRTLQDGGLTVWRLEV